MWSEHKIQDIQFSDYIPLFERLRYTLYALQVAVWSYEKDTMAYVLLRAAMDNIYRVLNGMPDEVVVEWGRLCRLPSWELVKEARSPRDKEGTQSVDNHDDEIPF
jgi:hypothetical protein